jgi:isopenicillin N synthase-like dioxygenase
MAFGTSRSLAPLIAEMTLERPALSGKSAHTDYGGFTILSREDIPGGLQVRTRAGDGSTSIPPPPSSW